MGNDWIYPAEMALEPFADQLKCQSGPSFSHFYPFFFSVDIYAQLMPLVMLAESWYFLKS